MFVVRAKFIKRAIASLTKKTESNWSKQHFKTTTSFCYGDLKLHIFYIDLYLNWPGILLYVDDLKTTTLQEKVKKFTFSVLCNSHEPPDITCFLFSYICWIKVV